MSNIFSFVGTIVRDAEAKHLPSGQTVANVTVANNQGFGDKQTALFIRCAIWGKKAESGLIPLLVKGQQVFVSGELTQREYESNGKTGTSLELNANILDLVGGKREVAQTAQPTQRTATVDDFDPDLPF